MLILALVVLFRVTYGGVDMRARRSANEEELSGFQLAGSNLNGQHGQHQPHDPILGGHGEEGHGHGEGHGYQVFHVEFSRVEVPFIIALWIFVSSLAKIGFHMTPMLHHVFPESCLLIVVGIIIGFLLFWTTDNEPPSPP